MRTALPSSERHPFLALGRAARCTPQTDEVRRLEGHRTEAALRQDFHQMEGRERVIHTLADPYSR